MMSYVLPRHLTCDTYSPNFYKESLSPKFGTDFRLEVFSLLIVAAYQKYKSNWETAADSRMSSLSLV